MSELGTISASANPIEKFREFLATRGMRMTRDRQVIVEEVFQSHDHFDTEQLVSRLANRVSRSTIYRRLPELVEAGLLRRVARPNGREVYELDYGYPQHDHFICGKCGTLIEFQASQLSPSLDRIADEHGFRVTGHRLEVYGVCAECSRPPRTRHRKLDMI